MTFFKTLRVFRFKLRSLVCAVAVFALLFAHLHSLESNRWSIVAEIERHNGTVQFGEASWISVFPARRIEFVSIPHESLSEFDATKLYDFPNLAKLEIVDVNATGQSGMRFHADKLVFDAAKHGDFLSRFSRRVEPRDGR